MGRWRWLLTPLWAGQIFTARKGFSGNPLLGSERLNRRGLHAWRALTAHRMADRRRRALARRIAPGDADAFARDGFVAKPGFLPPDQFDALVEELRTLRAPAYEMREGDAVTRRIALTPALLRRLPATRAMLVLPQWRNLLAYVASSDAAPMVYVQTIFSRRGEGGADPQTDLHLDTFHPTMKAWFFVHQVDAAAGPLTYVPGSHRLTRRRLAWEKRHSVRASRGEVARGGALRVTPDVLRRLRLPPAQRFTVAGNTLVVGDTGGIHARGASTVPSARVEIYAHSRRNPFMPVAGLDPWRLPGLRGRKSGLYFKLYDWMAPRGLMRPVWRNIGISGTGLDGVDAAPRI